MGAPSSVKLANITLHKHLQHILPSYHGKHPVHQFRLIDDIFGLFQGTITEQQNWVAFLNNSHLIIHFTMECSHTNIAFLD